MVDFGQLFLYRMTHVANLAHIAQYGITHRDSTHRNLQYRAIGDEGIIRKRDQKVLANGLSLGDYTPFYFQPRMPMLFFLQKNGIDPSDVVYCVSSVGSILASALPFIFTDGHALKKLTNIYHPKDLEHIEQLVDFEAVMTTYWNIEEDEDLKRRKEAEFLVQGDIPLSAIIGFATYDVDTAKALSVEFSHLKFGARPAFYFK